MVTDKIKKALIKYTLEYRTSQSERILTYNFEAESDDDALRVGKCFFVEKARDAQATDGATLEAIYKTPVNLLERRMVISETSEKDSPLNGGSCSEDSL
jgi:hypothetical protein